MMNTALATILASIRVQDEAIVRAQLLAKIRISEGPLATPCWLYIGKNVGRYGSFTGTLNALKEESNAKAAADNHQANAAR